MHTADHHHITTNTASVPLALPEAHHQAKVWWKGDRSKVALEARCLFALTVVREIIERAASPTGDVDPLILDEIECERTDIAFRVQDLGYADAGDFDMPVYFRDCPYLKSAWEYGADAALVYVNKQQGSRVDDELESAVAALEASFSASMPATAWDPVDEPWGPF